MIFQLVEANFSAQLHQQSAVEKTQLNNVNGNQAEAQLSSLGTWVKGFGHRINKIIPPTKNLVGPKMIAESK